MLLTLIIAGWVVCMVATYLVEKHIVVKKFFPLPWTKRDRVIGLCFALYGLVALLILLAVRFLDSLSDKPAKW